MMRARDDMDGGSNGCYMAVHYKGHGEGRIDGHWCGKCLDTEDKVVDMTKNTGVVEEESAEKTLSSPPWNSPLTTTHLQRREQCL